MSQQGINPALAAVSDVNIAHELMEEDLQKEMARNEAATKMAMEKELAAMAARKRAEESQVMMQAMLSRYEEMRDKLDSTKKHLEETNTKLNVQEQLTDKISKMKERVEAYASKKDAVSLLEGHVLLKSDIHNKKMEAVQEDIEGADDKATQEDEEKQRFQNMQASLVDHAVRVDQLKVKMAESEETFAKREQLKNSLEKAVEMGEKRADEQNRITVAREKMLELKLKELSLQKTRLERKRREQEERERATNDFFNMIDKQLDDMESDVVTKDVESIETGTVPKQKQNKEKGKGKKSKSAAPNVMSPKVVSPEPSVKLGAKLITTITNTDIQTNKTKSIQVLKVNKGDSKKMKIAAPECNPIIKPTEVKQEAVTAKVEIQEDNNEGADKTDMEKTEAQACAKEQIEKINSGSEMAEEKTKMSEEDVKATVTRIEGKVQSVRGNIADMAMSEQYLRTKQAMLMAKKKEKEMKIAENIAYIREEEVNKMREKVKHMQELLLQRKQKLKTTEEIMDAKNEEKKAIDKLIEKTKRRETYVENEIVDRVIFEKEPPKKK